MSDRAQTKEESALADIPTSNEPTKRESGFDLFETWKYYEHVAMHFNDLLMRLRSQSLGAVAAVATIAGGVLVKGESSGYSPRFGALSVVLTMLAVFWCAIWILDFGYYNRLLLGAVQALKTIEQESLHGNRVNVLELSKHIAHAASEGATVHDGSAAGRWWFYSLVLGALIVSAALSLACSLGWTGLSSH